MTSNSTDLESVPSLASITSSTASITAGGSVTPKHDRASYNSNERNIHGEIATLTAVTMTDASAQDQSLSLHPLMSSSPQKNENLVTPPDPVIASAAITTPKRFSLFRWRTSQPSSPDPQVPPIRSQSPTPAIGMNTHNISEPTNHAKDDRSSIKSNSSTSLMKQGQMVSSDALQIIDETNIESDRGSLFDEISFGSTPGNLHLSSNFAIEKLATRYGAVNVIRQLAADLAQRDAEVVFRRKQQEDRERELKRLLVECGVSVSEIERRLRNLEATSARKPNAVLDELLDEALHQDLVKKDSAPESNDLTELQSITESVESKSSSVLSKSHHPTSKPSSIMHSSHTDLLNLDSSLPETAPVISDNNINTRVRSTSQAFRPSEWIPQRIKDHVPQQVLNVVTAPKFQDRGPMELDTVVPESMQPPTLLQTWSDHYGKDDQILTDRFGFIYDRKRSPAIRSSSVSLISDKSPVTAEHPSEQRLPISRDTKPKLMRKSSVRAVNRSNSQLQGFNVREQTSLNTELVTENATAFNVNNDTRTSDTISTSSDSVSPSATSSGPASIKMLLAQLADLHDSMQRTQTARWDEFLRKINGGTSADPYEIIESGELLGVSGTGLIGKKGGKTRWKEFKALVQNGIPVSYRAKIWGECSGARTLKVPGHYDDLVNQDTQSESINQIDLDLYRTMPYNVFFGGTGPGVLKLRRVLIAFSIWNPSVGYCQGMNVIAAILLLTYATEEDAFWALVSLVENILPSGYFSSPLLTSRADQKVFNIYFADTFPKLNQHLKQINVDVEIITFDWFLSCFTDTLPAETLFRVWDVFLCVEGEVYLFRVALALFKIYERQLIDITSAAEVYSFMKNLINQPIRVDSLIRESEIFNGTVKDPEVRALRDKELKLMTSNDRSSQ